MKFENKYFIFLQNQAKYKVNSEFYSFLNETLTFICDRMQNIVLSCRRKLQFKKKI